MKILCVSDTAAPQLENAANLRRRYNDIDLVLSCGDMSASYLDFICTILGKPLMYVRGNHDEMYEQTPPGGVNLHDNYTTFKGITFYGLEGSIQYNRGKIQYTQSEMHALVLKIAPSMKLRQLTNGGRSVDIFVTHSPARGIHDIEDDLPHRGFDAFLRFMDWYKPRYMLHGHVHTWDRRKDTQTEYNKTCIMNINPYTILEIEPES